MSITKESLFKDTKKVNINFEKDTPEDLLKSWIHHEDHKELQKAGIILPKNSQNISHDKLTDIVNQNMKGIANFASECNLDLCIQCSHFVDNIYTTDTKGGHKLCIECLVEFGGNTNLV